MKRFIAFSFALFMCFIYVPAVIASGEHEELFEAIPDSDYEAEAQISAHYGESETSTPLGRGCIHKWVSHTIIKKACPSAPALHCKGCMIKDNYKKCSLCGEYKDRYESHTIGSHIVTFVSGVGVQCTRCYHVVQPI